MRRARFRPVNIGLPVITAPTAGFIEAEDRVEIDLAAGTLKNLTRGFGGHSLPCRSS